MITMVARRVVRCIMVARRGYEVQRGEERSWRWAGGWGGEG